MEKDIPIPHPTETPKEKNFDMEKRNSYSRKLSSKSQINPININQASKFQTCQSNGGEPLD